MRSRTLPIVALSAGCFLVLPVVLTGCGASGGDKAASLTAAPQQNPNSTGRATFTVRWPDRSQTRLVPFAANSIRIRLLSPDGTRLLGDVLLVRAPSGGTSSASFDRLPPGPVNVSATAYPGTDGAGVAQAAAQVPATVVAGETADVHLTMASTIDRIDLLPAAPTVQMGKTITLTAAVKNAAGEIVLTSPSTLAWTSSNPAIAKVDPSGLVSGILTGNASIAVTEQESGKSALVPVVVAPVGPQVIYTNDFQGTVGPEWSYHSVRQDPVNASDKLLGGFVNQNGPLVFERAARSHQRYHRV